MTVHYSRCRKAVVDSIVPVQCCSCMHMYAVALGKVSEYGVMIFQPIGEVT